MKPIPSGPELDLLINEKITKGEFANHHYSTELECAWRALEKFNPPFCEIQREDVGCVVHYFVAFQADYESFGISIESLPHAICLALLDELRLREEQKQWQKA